MRRPIFSARSLTFFFVCGGYSRSKHRAAAAFSFRTTTTTAAAHHVRRSPTTTTAGECAITNNSAIFSTSSSSTTTTSSSNNNLDDEDHREERHRPATDGEAAPAPLHLPLAGKTALITGASGGIGGGIARVFAEAGADVIVHYHTRLEGAQCAFEEINDRHNNYIAASSHDDGSAAAAFLPGRCLGIVRADFRDPKAVSEMFRSVTDDILPPPADDDDDDNRRRRRLDILVNNAGIVTKLAVEDDDDDLTSWHETMAVNLHAPLQLARLAHGHMKKKSSSSSSSSSKRGGEGGGGSGGGGRGRGGVIINNTSIHGTRSVEYMTAYAASKAALDSLTRGLACEYAPDGVRVNAIAPGVVPVERTAEAFSDPNVVDMWTPHLPLRRMGTIDDVARATLVLATNEWMSGTVLTVDGGMMARANMPIRPRPPPPPRS